jgi:hypothetical protein
VILADPELIASLINADRPRRARATLRGGSATHMIASRSRRKCRCGICGSCLENARWERIYVEKFADPDYYSTIRVRFSSSLAEIGSTGSQ